jgi:hypothetical protein
VRPEASKPFVSNDDAFLAFALTVRSSGIAGSIRLGIESEVTAMDLDNAVTIRLMLFDNGVRKATAKLTAYEVGKLLLGSKDD